MSSLPGSFFPHGASRFFPPIEVQGIELAGFGFSGWRFRACRVGVFGFEV